MKLKAKFFPASIDNRKSGDTNPVYLGQLVYVAETEEVAIGGVKLSIRCFGLTEAEKTAIGDEMVKVISEIVFEPRPEPSKKPEMGRSGK